MSILPVGLRLPPPMVPTTPFPIQRNVFKLSSHCRSNSVRWTRTSGPSGKFCNAQPRHKHCGQGAVRREWQALSKGCNTAHDACGAALREPLCECDSVLRFLPREGPLPAKRALIRTRTVALNVTELSTWPTRLHSFTVAMLFLALPLVCNAAPQPSLQDLVDKAEPNSVLVPPPGVYSGPVTLEFPLTIDGQGKVTIDAGGKGSVIYLDTDGAVLRNLHLTNSGNSHNDIDSGIQVRGNFNVIKDNTIDDCLFGVDLQQSEFNIVRRNKISSKDVELGMRGDAVRLWYRFNNQI